MPGILDSLSPEEREQLHIRVGYLWGIITGRLPINADPVEKELDGLTDELACYRSMVHLECFWYSWFCTEYDFSLIQK
jgi:hypothetical protein